MPIIPQYERRVQKETPGVTTPAISAPSPAAFGAETEAAGAQLGQAVQNLGTTAARILFDKQQEQQEKQVFEIEAEFRQSMQSLLLNQETDADGKPMGYLNRKLGQSAGATVEYDAASTELYNGMMSRPLSQEQRKALESRLKSHANSMRVAVIEHEARQGNLDFQSKLEANMNTYQEAAALQKPDALYSSIILATQDLKAGLMRMGVAPEGRIKQQVTSMIKANLKYTMDTNPEMALSSLNQLEAMNKGGAVPADVFGAVHNAIAEKDFEISLAALKQSGGDKRAAFKLVDSSKYPTSALYRQERIDMVNAAFAKTDYDTFITLSKRLGAGSLTEKDVNIARTKGLLTDGDATNLVMAINSSRNPQTKANQQHMKEIVDMLEVNVDSMFKDAEDRKKAKYLINYQANHGMDAKALISYAKELENTITIEKRAFWFDKKAPKLDYDFERLMAQEVIAGIEGETNRPVSMDVFNSIASYASSVYGKPVQDVNRNDIASFLGEVSEHRKGISGKKENYNMTVSGSGAYRPTEATLAYGMEDIAQNGAISNAIMILREKGKPVNPKSVAIILEATQ